MRRASLMFLVACAPGATGTVPADGAKGGGTTDARSLDAASASAIWAPHPGTSWQWQLTGTIDPSFDVAMYDIDLFDAPQATIDALHAAHRHVICYFSAGSYEPNRPDSAGFPAAALGKALDGWPDERWLDTRAPAIRAIMRARLDTAAAKHCDGVEPDNVDGYTNSSGFALTADTQLDYNRFLATEAHARGLSVGLKNDLDQVAALEPMFDWALNEQCFQYNECDALGVFVAANRAVFQVEYGGPSRASTICPLANARNFDSLVKSLDLGALPRIACR